MAVIISAGLGIPQHNIPQQTIKHMVKNIFGNHDRKVERLLPVFDHAAIESRQFVVDTDWFIESHQFKEKNDLYKKYAQKYSLQAIDHCLANDQFVNEHISFAAIDMIIYVSSTGLSTPSMDVGIMNSRPFRSDMVRMPLWGLGCAGGAIGLTHAFHWLSANEDKTVLLVCCELCSLTFQKHDTRKSNFVGTALFGDGASAVLLAGKKSPIRKKAKKIVPKICQTSSLTKKDSEAVMGWDISERGLEVIFSKSIPALVTTVWKNHIREFMEKNTLQMDAIHSYIAHPGGKKVLQAMEEVLHIPQTKLKYSYEILRKHGNMSSATVLYVLYQWMYEINAKGEKSILSALGPGFSSELLLLEWE